MGGDVGISFDQISNKEIVQSKQCKEFFDIDNPFLKPDVCETLRAMGKRNTTRMTPQHQGRAYSRAKRPRVRARPKQKTHLVEWGK